jgi:hypothetical protein
MSTNNEAIESQEPPKKKRGRPPKAAVIAKKAGSRVARGRPKGDAAIINEYKARMLASPKSVKVLNTIMDAALNDDHKNQAAAWKLVMDRMLPVSAFEKEVNSGNARNAIQINISGVGADISTQSKPSDEPLEAEFEPVEINDPTKD